MRLGMIAWRGHWSFLRDVLQKETFASFQQDAGEIGGREKALYLGRQRLQGHPELHGGEAGLWSQLVSDRKVLATPDGYPRIGMVREAGILTIALKEYFSPW